MQGIVVRVGVVAVGGAGEKVILQENVVYVVKTETGELISQQSHGWSKLVFQAREKFEFFCSARRGCTSKF